MILKNVSIVVDSLDMSQYLRGMTMTESVEQQDATAHGDTYRQFEAGLQSGTLTCQFFQDFTDATVDDKLSTLLTDTDGFTVVIHADGDTTGTSNPKYTMTMNLENYERFSGEVGDRAVCSADFALASGTFARSDT